MKIVPILVALILSFISTASAVIIDAGSIIASGTFTRNPLFNFNINQAQSVGTFGDLTVQSATGLFASHVFAGDSIWVNTDTVFCNPRTTQNAILPDMVWMVGGFTIETPDILRTGPNGSSINAFGVALSGNGFDPSQFGLGAKTSWKFVAQSGTSVPITLSIKTAFDDGTKPIPDTGYTLLLMVLSIGILCTLKVRMV